MNRFFRLFFLLIAYPCMLAAQDKKPVIAFASDTQEPMWIEKLWHRSHQNLKATKMIFNDVDSLHPKAFFILGDVVSLGKSVNAWKNIDRYIGETEKDSIRIYATPGNHEVMFNSRRGIRNFKKRFPDYAPAGFTEVADSVAIVLLNSNFATMSANEIINQNNWYQDKLNALDTDPAIKIVIVGCHHSPYTNSAIVRPSEGVGQNFVPAFIRSKKAVLFLSGHSHNFESFKMQGKYFLVIGGGGGLHQRLKAGNNKMHDLSVDYKPEFHYLQVNRNGDRLHVLSRKLKTDFSGFDDGFKLDIAK